MVGGLHSLLSPLRRLSTTITQFVGAYYEIVIEQPETRGIAACVVMSSYSTFDIADDSV